MGTNLIDQVSKTMYFKDLFLGKPVEIKDTNIYGIVTFLMKDIVKFSYVDKNGVLKEKSINCEYALKNLTFPVGYIGNYISIEYGCKLEVGTPVRLFNIKTQQYRGYYIYEKISGDSIWVVGVKNRNNNTDIEHFGIKIDAILNRECILYGVV